MHDPIPKFLIGSTIQDSYQNEFVLHTQKPRFIAVVADDYESADVVKWFDDPGADAQEIAALMREMGDWLAAEIRLAGELDDD